MSDTPRTDKAIADDSGDSGYINKLAQHARQLERELAEANQRIRELTECLESISKCDGAPDIDLAGEYRFGLHCGLEDRCINDIYDAADYGYADGCERALEWASGEAKTAIEKTKGDA